MHYNAMYISIASDAHGTSKGTRVRHPKAHNANRIERANLQSASALYVPLLLFRRKTAAFRSLPPGYSTSKAQPSAATRTSTVRHFAALGVLCAIGAGKGCARLC